jgi:hypothetical protein
MVVLEVAVRAVDVVQMLRMDNRGVPATGAVDVHVPRMGLVDLVRAIGAILDQPARPVVEVAVVQEVAVVSVTDDRVAAGFVVNVRVIGLAARARCHDPILGLPSNRLRPGRRAETAA